MNKRKSIRIKTTFSYLLKLSIIILPIIILLSLLCFWVTPIILKGILAFYVIETLAFYIYVNFGIYIMASKEYDSVMDEVAMLEDEDCEIIHFHDNNDLKAIIHFKNVDLMREIVGTYAFLNKSEWKMLYYHFCSYKKGYKKAFVLCFDSKHADIQKLKKYFVCENGVFYLM